MDRDDLPIGLVLDLLRAYEKYGVDPGPALAAADIPLLLLAQPQARVRPAQLEALATVAMRELQDEALGFYSRRLPPGSFELVTRACLSAADLGAALIRWCRYRRLLVDDIAVHLQTQGASAVLWVEELRPLDPQRRDLALLSILRHVHGLACWMINAQLPLQQACFPGAGPDYRDAYAGMFPGPVRFRAAMAALHFSADCLMLPVQRDEAATRAMLKQAPQLMVRPYQRDHLLAQRTRQLLLQHVVEPVTADALARELNLSARSLHRHLAQEGTSFQQVKDTVRREQAIALLNRSSLPLKRIASQLAFSGEKSFIRAFRRWTGTTPTVWRQRSQAPATMAEAPAVGHDGLLRA